MQSKLNYECKKREDYVLHYTYFSQHKLCEICNAIILVISTICRNHVIDDNACPFILQANFCCWFHLTKIAQNMTKIYTNLCPSRYEVDYPCSKHTPSRKHSISTR